jgi:hypothetical protein
MTRGGHAPPRTLDYRGAVIAPESTTTDAAATWVRVLRWSAWALTVCLVAAGILFVLVEFELIDVPGVPPGLTHDYPVRLGYFFADQRVLFPYEVAGSVLFALGFLALAAIGVGLRSLTPMRDPIGTIVATSFGFSGALLVISQLMFVGAKRVAIDPHVCQCRYAPEQLISQDRTLAMVEGIGDWLIAGALLLAAAGMLAIPALVARSGVLSRTWARASQLLAVLFLVAILGLLFEVDILFQLIAAVGSVILLPAWALWLERQLTARASTT